MKSGRNSTTFYELGSRFIYNGFISGEAIGFYNDL